MGVGTKTTPASEYVPHSAATGAAAAAGKNKVFLLLLLCRASLIFFSNVSPTKEIRVFFFSRARQATREEMNGGKTPLP